MILVEALEFTYHGSPTPAIRGISFNVAEGEIFGFLGPSGAGKSTTQKILIKLLQKYQGKVEVMGRDLRAWKSDFYERIGVSFELPNHYQKLTALENLQLFQSLYSGPTQSPLTLLAMVGLDEDAHTPVSAFSKGMQMRLNLVRALLHNPALIFLDEPTTGLDPVNARRVKEIVLGLKAEGRTVFLTTHDMHVADELCDRVAFMVDGQLALVDSPRALKLQHGKPRVRVEYRQDGAVAHADFPLLGLGENGEFLHLLRHATLETIHTLEASLEEIFVTVTGRGLT
jgi:fluoroquinolone transport system ATP-binding protein